MDSKVIEVTLTFKANGYVDQPLVDSIGTLSRDAFRAASRLDLLRLWEPTKAHLYKDTQLSITHTEAVAVQYPESDTEQDTQLILKALKALAAQSDDDKIEAEILMNQISYRGHHQVMMLPVVSVPPIRVMPLQCD